MAIIFWRIVLNLDNFKKNADSFLGKIKFKIRQKLKRNELIDTTITIKTSELLLENKKFFKKNNITLLITLITASITAISMIQENLRFVQSNFNFQSKNTWFFILGIILIATILMTTVIYIFSPSVKRYTNQLIRKQYDHEEFTAIFIVKTVIENTPKILVSKSELWNSYMLPYCHYDPENEDIDNPSVKLQSSVAEYLEVPIESFKISNNDFTHKTKISIKRNQSLKGINRINYRFYYVEFTDLHIRKNFLSKSINNKLIWKSKDELVEDSSTLLNNGDVLTTIDEYSLINQAPGAFPENYMASYDLNSKYRIIWNITNDCYYNCPICATNSGKGFKCETTTKEKEKILLSIASINKHIERLDISGGDPLKSKKDQEIIKLANRVLPYASISVTTTGEGLKNVDISQFKDIIQACDITYDIPYKRCMENCREYDYNLSNIRQIEGLRKTGINIDFNIHVPIHEETISKDIVYNILSDIKDIRPKEVKFIRLMPVGRATEKVSENYKPEKFLQYVKECKKELNIDFKMSMNCSLRVRSVDKNKQPLCQCKMLEEKIGIDHKGNVFTCIWGAYLNIDNDDIKKNPFYIGNCLEKPLCDILTDKHALKYFSNNYINGQKVEPNSSYCRVCAYAKYQTINLDSKQSDGLKYFRDVLNH